MCRGGNVTGNVAESVSGRVGRRIQVTIKDIAKLCGVSVSTVSRVINDRPDVSPEVRAAVLEAVRSSNYVPNNSARGLGSSRSGEPLLFPDHKGNRQQDRRRGLYDGDAADKLNGG